MLKLTDAELEFNAESLWKAFPPDFGDDLIPEVRIFRRWFREELTSCESVKGVLLSSRMFSWLRVSEGRAALIKDVRMAASQ